MNRPLFAILILAAGLSLSQTRTVTVSAADVTTDVAQLELLPDGGCAARWCGQVVDSEGDRHRECSQRLEVQGATARSRCLDVLGAGVGPVRRALRFDGGTP